VSISSDGQICYGLSFDEDTEFPWGEQEVDEWWREEHNFVPSTKIYDAEGQYIGGERPSKEVMEAYYAEQRAWDAAHPVPVERVLHCSYDYPMVILAVPGTFKNASRGYPEAIDQFALTITDAQREALLSFCREYEIEIPGEPKWWLSSMYG